MSSPFNLHQSGAEHLRERQQERMLAWAENVFGEPKPDGHGINPRLYELGYISQEQEAVLYRDLHSRDSEVGLGLLDWRKAELLDSITYLRTSIKKREHTATLARSRREALEQFANDAQAAGIDQAGPQAELAAEQERLEMELTYLRAHSSKIDALERMIQLIGSESALRVSRASEQTLRLFSQSWRGLVKIKSWALHFEDSAPLPALQPYKQPGEPEGFLLPLSESLRAVAISRDTAGYLLHMLEGINLLAEAYRNHLTTKVFSPDAGWGPAHRLIRAIVEIFYFCNFELPFSYVDLAVDPEDPAQIWVYNYQSGDWQIVAEDANSSRTLKRVGAEAAQLLINSGALLKCRRDDDLSALIEEEAPQLSSPGEAHNYRLFMCSGLSEFDLDPASQRIKFRMAFSSMGRLLEAIAAGQSNLSLVGESRLGGPLETLLGMALLDSRAFSLPEGVQGPDPIARFQILSQFWRAIGRRRAIAMLGEDYVKQVTGGLAVLGEQGPDHPTFLTMRAGTLFGATAIGAHTTVGGETVAVPAVNPFTLLGLADQIRFLDLNAQSWAMAEELLGKLREVHSQGKLRRIIETLPGLVESRKEIIESRFSVKWLTANNWHWTFMRTCAPVAWDFWTKISGNEAWDGPLLKLPPYQALALLLRLLGDVVRLLLVIELSDAEVAQSLPVEAESAGQSIVQGLEGFLEGGERLPPPVAEAINFYYDPEVRFDSWLAFTSSFRRYLGQMGQDLKALNVDAKLPAAIDLLIGQIAILYPVREPEPEAAEEAAAPEPEPQPDIPAIDEVESQRIEYLLSKLLGVPEQDNWTFLKLVSIAARTEMRGLLGLAAAYSSIVTTLLPSNAHRMLLFNMPGAARNFFNFLMHLSEQGTPTSEMLAELRPQVKEYFEQLDELHKMLVPLTNQIPHLLPADRERLLAYLTTGQQKGKSLNFLLLLACNRLILDLGDFDEMEEMQAERAEAKIRAYLRGQLGAAIEEPSVEVYPLGGGRILARRNQCIFSSSSESFEPYWSEISQPRSQALYARFTAVKFTLAAEVFGQEFPDYQVIVR